VKAIANFYDIDKASIEYYYSFKQRNHPQKSSTPKNQEKGQANVDRYNMIITFKTFADKAAFMKKKK
jgi:hypothetical protein